VPAKASLGLRLSQRDPHGEAELRVVESTAQAAVMLHPTRLRLLRELAEPGSAASLARRLELPRQQLNYHLHALEQAGLIEQVETRRRGNCIERVVRATARSYVISPSAIGESSPSPEAVADRFSATYLIAVAARTLRDLGRLRALADAAGKRLATLTIQAEVGLESPAARKAFTQELAAAVEGVIAKWHREGGRPFRVTLGAYPSPPPDQDE
jgi:DNA-binding transcriptional ArsR family regulator